MTASTSEKEPNALMQRPPTVLCPCPQALTSWEEGLVVFLTSQLRCSTTADATAQIFLMAKGCVLMAEEGLAGMAPQSRALFLAVFMVFLESRPPWGHKHFVSSVSGGTHLHD